MIDVEDWRRHWDERGRIADPMARDGTGSWTLADRRRMTDYVLEQLDLRADHAVLEVGCGSGWFLRQIAQRVARTVGTDLSSAMLAHCEGAGELVCCGADEVSFPPQSFDRILLFGVCHYFPSQDYFERVIRNLCQMTKVKGLVFIGDVYFSEPVCPDYTHFSLDRVTALLAELDVLFRISAQPRFKRDYHRPFGLKYDLTLFKD